MYDLGNRGYSGDQSHPNFSKARAARVDPVTALRPE
jgi:hypothetical protein